MVANATVIRNNKDLTWTLGKIKELQKRLHHITLDDVSQFANQTYIFANQFSAMLDLALIITKGALLRNEFRGAHFKPEYPKRDDEAWLKTTIATYDPAKDEPVITYEEVDVRHVNPKGNIRDYTQGKRTSHTLENIPKNVVLPI